jgi:hypothetical protein
VNLSKVVGYMLARVLWAARNWARQVAAHTLAWAARVAWQAAAEVWAAGQTRLDPSPRQRLLLFPDHSWSTPRIQSAGVQRPIGGNAASCSVCNIGNTYFHQQGLGFKVCHCAGLRFDQIAARF